MEKTELIENIHLYKDKYGKYPNSREMDACPWLPTARTVQRNFGGLQKLKKEMGIRNYNENRGRVRRKKTKEINERSRQAETYIYEKLVEKYGRTRVHRHFPLSDDSRSNLDFAIFDQNGQLDFFVEVFFAVDSYSFVGCLNSKLKKYHYLNDCSYGQCDNYNIIYIQQNENMSQKEIDKLIKNRKTKLPTNWSVLALAEFVV